MNVKKIYLGADHAGFLAKEKLINDDVLNKYEVIDCGTDSTASTNYAEYAFKVGELVANDPNSIGILICGTGTGMCIAANKVKGVRAALACDEKNVALAVEHNNANVLCFGARFMEFNKITELIKVFLQSEFQNGRHQERINAIISYEKHNN